MYGELLVYARITYLFIVLIYFSILDIKYRDIPDRQVWASLAGAIILFLASIPLHIGYGIEFFIAYLAVSLFLGPILFYGLYKTDMIGGADVVVVAEIALLLPTPDIYSYTLMARESLMPIRFPPILPILLYSNLLIVVIIPFNIVYNMLRYRSVYSSLKTSFSKKLVLLATAKPVKAIDYLKLKHRYLLEEFRVTEHGVERSIRTSFDINEEYTDHQRIVKELIDKGLIKPDEYIVVTYGIPYLVPLLLGTALFMVIGDLLMQILFQALA